MSPRRAVPLSVLIPLVVGLVLPACRRDDPKAIGLELLPVEGSPFVAVRIQVEVGSAFDPPGKEGLCRLAWNLLASGGSSGRGAGELAADLAPLGAALRFQVDKEASAFSAVVRAADLEAFYAVLREALLEPGFRDDDFARVKAAQLGSLRDSAAGGRDSPLAEAVLHRMMDGLGPYGHPDSGWEESVASITVDEARAFYEEHFVSGNLSLGLAGGFPAGFPERMVRDFVRLPRTFTPRLVPSPPPAHDGIRAVLAERPGGMASVAIAIPMDATKADDDFAALWLAATHLGEPGLPIARMNESLAGGALASAAHAGLGTEAFPAPGLPRQSEMFMLRIGSIPPGSVPFAVDWTLNELRLLAEEGLPEERFALIRDHLLGSLGRRSRSLEERLALRMEARALGSEPFLERAARELPGLSAGDVRAAVRKHLAAKGLFLAVATDAPSTVREGLLSAAPPLPLRPEDVRAAAAPDFFRSGARPAR